MRRLFLLTHAPGKAWKPGTPRDQQMGWRDHAEFMNKLARKGFVLLGGPISETEALLVIDAKDENEIHLVFARRPMAYIERPRGERLARMDYPVGARAGTSDHMSASSLKFSFSKMNESDAREILLWRYEAPYDFYDPVDSELENDVQKLVEPTNLYLAVRDRDDDLIGYYCFGSEAQVAGGDYSEMALDVAGGVRPDLVGTGIGASFIQMAMNFGQMFFRPGKFRATIAAFNDRALRTCEKAGFIRTERFSSDDGTEFVVLLKEAEE